MLGLEAGGLKAVQVIQEQRGDLDPGVDNGRSRVTEIGGRKQG